MIIKNESFNIYLDIEILFSDENKIKSFEKDINRITDKYIGKPINYKSILNLKLELEELLHSKEEYEDISIKNNNYYNKTQWSMGKLLKIYAECYPERFEKKDEYTNMEVNNMLCDLNIMGMIGGYDSPAVPYNMPFHNDKICREEYITLEEPIINF